MKVRCKNCRLEFKADDESRVERCPRCDSDKLDKTREAPKPAAESVKPMDAPKVYSSAGAVVYGETKDAWKSYHSTSGTGVCPHCGGTSFEFNYKRKEKICRKCGEILPLPRRMA